MQEKRATTEYFLHLVSCGLSGASPLPCPDGVDMMNIYRLCKLHRVDDVAFSAVNRLASKPDFFERWYKRHCMAVARSATQLYEYDTICAFLVKAGVKVLPYKGIVLRGYYPEASMRYMSDIDMLYLAPDDDHGLVKAAMESLGYTTEQFDTGVHDVYHKPPVMSVEMHRIIFSQKGEGFLSNADYMAAATPDERGVYVLPLPYLYLASLTHLVKHLRTDAADARSVIDLYLLGRAMTAEQAAQTEALVADAGLMDTNAIIRAVADAWLDGAPADARTQACADYLLFAIADARHADAKYLNSYRGEGSVASGKLRYFGHLILPGYSYMKKNYPVLRKAPILLPIMWPVRWVDVLLHQRGRAKKAVRRFDSLDQAAAEREKQMLHLFGLQ